LQTRIIDERQYIDLQGDRRTAADCRHITGRRSDKPAVEATGRLV
jgi:hypothetical protein